MKKGLGKLVSMYEENHFQTGLCVFCTDKVIDDEEMQGDVIEEGGE